MSEKGVFRTKLFGGFNKKDVLKYFEELKSEQTGISQQVVVENEQLKTEISVKEQKVQELLEKNDELSKKNSELEEKVASLSQENDKNANLEAALNEANKALAESEDFKSRFEELSRKILKIKSDLIMKESEYKRLESRYGLLKSEIEMLPIPNDEDIVNAKIALDKANKVLSDAQTLNMSISSMKAKVED